MREDDTMDNLVMGKTEVEADRSRAPLTIIELKGLPQGITFIEILIVLATLGIVAAILVPNLLRLLGG